MMMMMMIAIHDHDDDAVLLLFLLPNHDEHDEHKKKETTASVCILKYQKVIERLISLSILYSAFCCLSSYLLFVSLEAERSKE